MTSDKPLFRFHPGAYERGAFVASDEPCDVCERPSVWLYTGTVYAEGEERSVCARCIAKGALAGALEGDYQLHDADFDDDVDEALADEVMQRTPGFETFNAFTWPVLNGKPLVYVGHGDEEATWKNPDAAAAIRKLYEDEFEEELDGPTPYALVFKEVDGSRHVAIADLD
jgi:uncharacterized protein CbrC (UPF0167 family)